MENIKQIELYQLDELNDEILFISKSDMSLKYLYELNLYWKEFAFDLLNKFYPDDLAGLLYDSSIDDLLIFIKNNYKMLIEKYNLNIDFRDYIELNDYVTLKEWLELDNTFIEQKDNKVFLSQKIDVNEIDF